MRTSKVIKIIIAVLLFCLLNSLLTFMLTPPVASSEKMWAQYRNVKDIDTVFTGTSLCYAAIDCNAVDSVLGSKSFNMGTASQELNNSYEAIEAAIKDHNIKRVILTFSYLNLIEYNNIQAETCFFKERIKGLPFTQKVKESFAFAFNKRNFSKPTSINFIFPWIYSHVKFRPGPIIANTKKKLNGNKEAIAEMASTINTASKDTINYNTIGNENSKTVYVGLKYNFGKFTGEVFDQLNSIISLCKNNNVDLMLINPPKPRLDVLCYGDEYFNLNKFVNEYAEKQGFDYYDFNIIKPEMFVNEEDYYLDFEHMNVKGQQAFSYALANFIKLRDSGADLSDLFYTENEYFNSIKTISCIYFDIENKTSDSVDITAHAYTGKNVTVLYELLLKSENENDYSVIQDYSTESSFHISSLKPGNYTIRVNARTEVSSTNYDRYYEQALSIR